MWVSGQQMWLPRHDFTARCWALICGPQKSIQQARMLNLRMLTPISPWVMNIIAWDYLMIHDLPRVMDVALCSTRASIISPLKLTQMPNLLLWLLASISLGLNWHWNLVTAILKQAIRSGLMILTGIALKYQSLQMIR